MTKEEIKAYWNYSRVIKTLPLENIDKDPNLQVFIQQYNYLEVEFCKLLNEINYNIKENEKRD